MENLIIRIQFDSEEVKEKYVKKGPSLRIKSKVHEVLKPQVSKKGKSFLRTYYSKQEPVRKKVKLRKETEENNIMLKNLEQIISKNPFHPPFDIVNKKQDKHGTIVHELENGIRVVTSSKARGNEFYVVSNIYQGKKPIHATRLHLTKKGDALHFNQIDGLDIQQLSTLVGNLKEQFNLVVDRKSLDVENEHLFRMVGFDSNQNPNITKKGLQDVIHKATIKHIPNLVKQTLTNILSDSNVRTIRQFYRALAKNRITNLDPYILHRIRSWYLGKKLIFHPESEHSTQMLSKVKSLLREEDRKRRSASDYHVVIDL